MTRAGLLQARLLPPTSDQHTRTPAFRRLPSSFSFSLPPSYSHLLFASSHLFCCNHVSQDHRPRFVHLPPSRLAISPSTSALRQPRSRPPSISSQSNADHLSPVAACLLPISVLFRGLIRLASRGRFVRAHPVRRHYTTQGLVPFSRHRQPAARERRHWKVQGQERRWRARPRGRVDVPASVRSLP